MTCTRSYIIGIILLFLLLEAVLIAFVDRPLSESIRMIGSQHPALIDFFRAYTDLGKSKWYLWPAGFGILLCTVLIRKKSFMQTSHERLKQAGEYLLFLFVCVAVSGIVTDIIKPVLGRARPVELEHDGLYGFHPLSFSARWNSLPSGHATTAFALAFVLSGFFPRIRVPVFFLAICLAASRVMVNAHFLSDVIAGGAIAFLTVTILHRAEKTSGIFRIKQCIFPIDDSLSPR